MDLPEISTEVIESFYSILLGMEVDLDEDPLQFGPKRLNGKIAKARGMLTECEGLYLKVSSWLQRYRSIHRDMELELDIKTKHLLANDPEVRAGRNVAMQQAGAMMKLRDEVRALSKVARSQENLEYLLKSIRSKKADLKDVQGRLRDQIKLCQEELGLGQRWGSKPQPGRKTPDLDSVPRANRTTLRDLHEMIQGTGVTEPDLGSLASPVDEAEPLPVDEPVAEGMKNIAQEVAGNGLTDDAADDFLTNLVSDEGKPAPKSSVEDILDGLDL